MFTNLQFQEISYVGCCGYATSDLVGVEGIDFGVAGADKVYEHSLVARFLGAL